MASSLAVAVKIPVLLTNLLYRTYRFDLLPMYFRPGYAYFNIYHWTLSKQQSINEKNRDVKRSSLSIVSPEIVISNARL